MKLYDPFSSPPSPAFHRIPLPAFAELCDVVFPLPPPRAAAFFPPAPLELEVTEWFEGRSWQRLEVDGPRRGPRARCELCGALYSSSPAADPHPCLAISRAPASSWDPGELELEHRPRTARGRPHAPSVLASSPVHESVGRRRCFCCRKPIGAAAAAAAVVVLLARRGRELRVFRHRWCRARAAGGAA